MTIAPDALLSAADVPDDAVESSIASGRVRAVVRTAAVAGDARSVLAYVILTDQLTRNAFRDSGRAFALDEQALVASLDAQSRGIDTSLGFLERYVLYLPMMHAEDKEVQARCVSVFATLASDASKAGEDEIAGMLRGAHDYAVRHQVIVERFGRFPHRNSLLDRTSTPDEAMFLLEPGAGF